MMYPRVIYISLDLIFLYYTPISCSNISTALTHLLRLNNLGFAHIGYLIMYGAFISRVVYVVRFLSRDIISFHMIVQAGEPTYLIIRGCEMICELFTLI